MLFLGKKKKQKQMEQYLKHIQKVAQYCCDTFGDDYHEALNAAEILPIPSEDVKYDAFRVHAILEGEL